MKVNNGDIYCNKDYEPSAIDRDLAVEEICRAHGKNLYSYKDQVIFEENDVLKADGKPYTVYTPIEKPGRKDLHLKCLNHMTQLLQKIILNHLAQIFQL